eukprot:jgi/Mesvir1/22925/Mv19441-RA.1
MALDPARVIKPHPIPEELLCTICMGVLRNPMEGPCEHLACRECLDGWLQRSGNKTCPTCRQPLAERTIKPGHQAVRSQLDAFEVTCENATRGCTSVVTLGVLPGHLSSCGKGIERCSNSGCAATVLREDLAKHHQACPHRIVSCRRCDAKIKHQNAQNHLQHKCPGVEVACQHNGGCGQTVRRDAMATHIKTECSRATVTCEFPGCQRQMARGDMKDHLDNALAEHMTALVGHVASLSLELQEAKSKIMEQGAKLEKLMPQGPAFQCTATLHEDSKKINHWQHPMACCTAPCMVGLAPLGDISYLGVGVVPGFCASDRKTVWNLNDQTCKKILDVKPACDFEMSWMTLKVEGGVPHGIFRDQGVITWTPPDYQPRLVWRAADYKLNDMVVSQGKLYGAFNNHCLYELPSNGGTSDMLRGQTLQLLYQGCREIFWHRMVLSSTIPVFSIYLFIFHLEAYARASHKLALICTLVAEKKLAKFRAKAYSFHEPVGKVLAENTSCRKTHLRCRFGVWDTTTNKLVAGPTTNGVQVEPLEVTHLALGDGVLYGIAPSQHTIRAWSTVNHTHVADIRALTCHLVAVGGGFLFAAASNGDIKVWSTKDYSRAITELTEHRTKVTALLVHDGKLFSGSEDGKIKVWRIPSC